MNIKLKNFDRLITNTYYLFFVFKNIENQKTYTYNIFLIKPLININILKLTSIDKYNYNLSLFLFCYLFINNYCIVFVLLLFKNNN